MENLVFPGKKKKKKIIETFVRQSAIKFKITKTTSLSKCNFFHAVVLLRHNCIKFLYFEGIYSSCFLGGFRFKSL